MLVSILFLVTSRCFKNTDSHPCNNAEAGSRDLDCMELTTMSAGYSMIQVQDQSQYAL